METEGTLTDRLGLVFDQFDHAREMAQVRLTGRFPVGTDVELRERTGTRFSEGEKIVARKKVGEDSTVTFTDGVVAGEKYWITGRVGDGDDAELRTVAMTGKVPAPEKERRERPDADAARPFQREDPRWSVERIPTGVPIGPIASPGNAMGIFAHCRFTGPTEVHCGSAPRCGRCG